MDPEKPVCLKAASVDVSGLSNKSLSEPETDRLLSCRTSALSVGEPIGENRVGRRS
jgi:hypothetical protein